jgi:hypothetical protein
VTDGIPRRPVAFGISLTGDEKRAKTNASDRIVPVPKDLLRCCFLAFAESQRLCGGTNLFRCVRSAIELPLRERLSTAGVS